MGYIVEITEDKLEKLSGHVEQGLRHLGKAMQCVDDWMQESGMGERGGYRDEESYSRYGKNGGGMQERYPYISERSGRGGSMGYKDDDDWDDMKERRYRDSRGRYK